MAGLGILGGSLLIGFLFANDRDLAGPFSFGRFLFVSALVALGPLMGWMVVASYGALAREVWTLVPVTIAVVGPFILGAIVRKPSSRRAWLAAGSLLWFIAGMLFTGVTLT